VRIAIEVLAPDDIGDAIRGTVFEQEAAKDRLFRFDRMRRYFQCFDLGIVGHAE
jgi:hypothetical protein